MRMLYKGKEEILTHTLRKCPNLKKPRSMTMLHVSFAVDNVSGALIQSKWEMVYTNHEKKFRKIKMLNFCGVSPY